MKVLAAMLLVLGGVVLGCPTAFAQPAVKFPLAPSTIPADVMYTLGQQASLLTTISGRVDKVETKIDDLRTDVTRINTFGGIAVLLVTVIVGPIVVYRVQHRLGGKPA